MKYSGSVRWCFLPLEDPRKCNLPLYVVKMTHATQTAMFRHFGLYSIPLTKGRLVKESYLVKVGLVTATYIHNVNHFWWLPFRQGWHRPHSDIQLFTQARVCISINNLEFGDRKQKLASWSNMKCSGWVRWCFLPLEDPKKYNLPLFVFNTTHAVRQCSATLVSIQSNSPKGGPIKEWYMDMVGPVTAAYTYTIVLIISYGFPSGRDETVPTLTFNALLRRRYAHQ
jgi:hypothetical protein